MTANIMLGNMALRVWMIGCGLLTGSAAIAQDVSPTKKPFYCVAFKNPGDGSGVELAYSSVLLGIPDDKVELERSFMEAAEMAGTMDEYPRRDHSYCKFFDDPDEAIEARDFRVKYYREERFSVPKYFAGELNWAGNGLASPLPIEPKTRLAKSEEDPTTSVQEQPQKPGADSLREAEVARSAARVAREAEFQRKLADHQVALAEHQRKVAEREAELARQAAHMDEAQRAAARAQAEHEAKMASYQRELEASNRRQQEYEAAQRRHMECLSWNKQACDDIVAGKPAIAAEEESASTDTDPNTCVTTPEIQLNAAFEGNTSASVMNGCGQPVDIRICLKRNSSWNCGVTSAVASQARAVHSSFEATGEVFVDARTTGNAKRFADPPN